MFEVDLEYEEFIKGLELTHKQLQTALNKSLRRVAYQISVRARREAPKITGELKRTIKVFANEGALNRLGQSGLNLEVGSSNELLIQVIVADIFYAPYVELGTNRRSANPFMERAIIASAPTFYRDISKTFKDVISEKYGG